MFQSVILLAIAFASVNGKLYTENTHDLKSLFEQFKKDFSKVYETMEEENRRFSLFVENLKLADHRNALELRHNGNEVHGITKFSDLSQAEFESRYLTADASKRTNGAEVAEITTAPDSTLGLVDWTGKYTTEVKDQGYCGSCWAFSATEQIESDHYRTKGLKYYLSPAQITQCDTTSYGCSGGWTENAYNYVKKAGGIEAEADYPYSSSLYQGVTGKCAVNSSKFKVKVTGYTTIKGESAMASYVQSTGPLSVCVDANNWNSYKSGIMTTCGKSVDHCVQAVGVEASTGGYWKVRNSWATSWGEAGFIRLAYGANTCAITNDPTYATVTTA